MNPIQDIRERLNELAEECAWPTLWKITVIVSLVAMITVFLTAIHLYKTY